MNDLFEYIKETMIDQKSPAEEVMVVDGIVCVRVEGELFGIKIEPIEISFGKKTPEKKKPVKKKVVKKKKPEEKTPAKKTSSVKSIKKESHSLKAVADASQKK